MVSFENFVKSMELKVTPSFCFAFKIPDDVTATNVYGFLIFRQTLRLPNSTGMTKFAEETCILL